MANFRFPAQKIYNRLRGFQPWPGCYTLFREKKLAITSARPRAADSQIDPGVMRVDGDLLLVGCGEGSALELLEVQPEGKRRMPAADFVRGYRPMTGERLGE